MDGSEFGVSHTERESMHRYTVTRINIAMYKNRCLLRIKDMFEITAPFETKLGMVPLM